MKAPKLFTTFSGIGAAEEAKKRLDTQFNLEPSDVNIAAQWDEDKQLGSFPNQVRNKWHPAPNLKDVSKIDWENEPLFDNLKMVIGGSPCTGFSRRGSKKGLDNEESKFAKDFVAGLDVLLKRNPGLIYVLENVVDATGENQLAKLLQDKLGWNQQPYKINAGSHSNTNRERIFLTNLPEGSIPYEITKTGLRRPLDLEDVFKKIGNRPGLVLPFEQRSVREKFGTPSKGDYKLLTSTNARKAIDTAFLRNYQSNLKAKDTDEGPFVVHNGRLYITGPRGDAFMQHHYRKSVPVYKFYKDDYGVYADWNPEHPNSKGRHIKAPGNYNMINEGEPFDVEFLSPEETEEGLGFDRGYTDISPLKYDRTLEGQWHPNSDMCAKDVKSIEGRRMMALGNTMNVDSMRYLIYKIYKALGVVK